MWPMFSKISSARKVSQVKVSVFLNIAVSDLQPTVDGSEKCPQHCTVRTAENKQKMYTEIYHIM